ncbi:TonB-dependent siderophore receptor [Caulobacter sp. S45]|uniref:TonB-dependent receptor plug domain-containing protein n=1 Tax=Caulobacter sp. S45 TaxID=1641861 RepID=UPI00131D98F7|nr:TonB-dependent receptor plug domain-containing protein [Caulobacter sp. S45]
MRTAGRHIAGLFAATAASAMAVALATSAQAQDASTTSSTAAGEVVVTGTREVGTTVFSSLSPVSVYSGQTLNSTISTNLGQTLAEISPGFDVKRLPAADGPEFIQPLSQYNLSPDFTLILLNGKRFHNSAYIEGSGNSSGSQSSDLNQIPSIALGSAQLLTDGASAQYGSDAIAGVVNLITNIKPGLDVFAQGSQYYAGDGTSGQFGLRAATALPGGGHLMVATEYSNDGLTSRTIQRPDAISFQAANPQLTLSNPVQRWGNPSTTSWKYAFDGAEPIGDFAEGYIFGTMSNGSGIADINWRNPTTNASVYGANPALGAAPNIFPGFNVNNIYPGGFTPREGTNYNDQQVDIGIRNMKSDVFTWDVSASYGHNDTGFFLDNSINASLGPASPLNFQLGHYMDTDFDLNADFNYRLKNNFTADPIDIAFGAQRRVETFEARSGDLASYEVGPGAAAGLAPGANGFPGINLQQAGTHSETSYAGYVDIAVPITKQAKIEFAARDESYDLFGNTFNYKIAGAYQFIPDQLQMHVSYNTGFKAPTPGQIFSTSTNQGLDSVTLQLVTSGRISPLNPLAQALGAKALTPETSTDINGGINWHTHFGLSGSVDLFQIDVANRLQTSPSFTLTPAEIAQLEASGVVGASAFSSVSFYTNAFSTATRGINLSSTYIRHLGPGSFNLTGLFSYYNTQVTSGSLSAATQDAARLEYEKSAPDYNATVTATYTVGKFSALGRMRYYGSWTDSSGNATGTLFESFPGVAFLDLELTYKVTPNLFIRTGAENIGDFYPAQATNQANRGLIYSRNSPYDTNGGDYFVRVQADF